MALVGFGIAMEWRTASRKPADAPQAQQAERQSNGPSQHHTQPQTQALPHGDRNAAPQQGQAARDGNQDNVAWWTVASAVVTAGSAVVQALSAAFTFAATVALVLIGRAQRQISEGQKAISADQAEIMAGQRDIAAEQTAILKEQTRTARVLANLEGPALFVRKVGPTHFERLGSAEPDSARDHRPSTRVHFTNYGRTPAVLLAVEGDIVFSKPPPSPPRYGPEKGQPVLSQVVEVGKEIEVVMYGGFMTEEDAEAAMRGGMAAFYVYGRLIYRDLFGERAETGFGYTLSRGESSAPLRSKAHNYDKRYDPDDQNAPHAHYER